MTPLPEEPVVVNKGEVKETYSRPLTGDEVVISGISGIFPKSDSTQQFMENLYNKVDMVTDEDPRWIFNHPEVPQHLGQVNGMGKFDAQFFRVHYKQACTMEPMSRKLLEHAYSAIYDSGINPLQLRGRKVGVFIGSTFSESEKIVIYETIQRNGFGITGCNKAMYANRISYWIDGKGPSYALDLACASSMACLEHAYRSISTGQCDAAIVGGCNLCMHPNVSLNLKRAGFLCLDGKTKCFDKNGDGYVRSDAISVLFLQRAKDAKRIYSEVYYAKGNYSLRDEAEFMPVREPKDIEAFLEQFYSEIRVSPNDVEYVEAHGAAIANADGNELEAIGKVFGKEKPIKVGSVKSNMGNSEPASGVCALTKVCLAYHEGKLPANLHYYEPQDHIPSVKDGRVEVLQEHSPFNRGFAALNSFSYSGANIHILLKGRFKSKELERYKTTIPHLVLASGRQESCVKVMLDTLKKQPVDPEQIGLLHSIHEFDIPGHMCRGYTILDTNEDKETISLAEKIDYYQGGSRPIWFVYSGMGSQWAGMGAELMRIPTFAASIYRCHKALEPKGIDIIRILTEPDKTIYDNILNSFVGIAAVQIGLTDILKELGIVPDNIIGHSVGELGCAYADGCFTTEEMILSAYSRGLVSVQTPLIRGSMAAVGLGFKNVLGLCPPEIEVACHNSSESSTISGPADVMKAFVAELTSQGVFAKEVPCSNIAYHSKYIANAGSGLLKFLSEVITDPKPRSEKWVSSSVPEDKWDSPAAKYSSAEYHTNNLLNYVLFEETARHIPDNAILIEVAPHGLLQAILKRSHPGCTNVALTRRNHSSPVQFLLEAVGKLYQEGLNPKVDALYPKIEFPVSTETPMLSHFVEWVHTEDWPQAKYNRKDRVTATAREFVMSIQDDDYKYLEGHTVDGTVKFPEAAMLVLVWETLAMQKGVNFKDLSIIFHDVLFHDDAYITLDVPLRLTIMIHKGDTKFEVSHEKVEIASGYISLMPDNAIFRRLKHLPNDCNETYLDAKDFYRIMHLRGYSYRDDFRSVLNANINRTKANVKWTGEWVTFLDSLIQFNAFARKADGLSVPKLIKKLTINTDLHKSAKSDESEDDSCYTAERHENFKITRCGGVEIDGMEFTDHAKVDHEPDLLEQGSFIPYYLSGDVDIETALLINLQIIAENTFTNDFKITEIYTNTPSNVYKHFESISNKIPQVIFTIDSVHTKSADYENMERLCKSNVFAVENIMSDKKKIENLYNAITSNSMILSLEGNTTGILKDNKHFNIIAKMSIQRKTLMLLSKNNLEQSKKVTYLPIVHDRNFSWVARVSKELQKAERMVLVSQQQYYCGLLRLVKTLRKEYGNKISAMVIDDCDAPSFNPEDKIYQEQLRNNLTINILKKGRWGGYYYLPCPKSYNLQNVNLVTKIPGKIENLTWIESKPTPSNHSVQVCYAGPSIKDTQKAVGVVKDHDNSFGRDFSGFDHKGDRVMGLVSKGAIASTVVADPDLLWPVPENWSLEEAATVPLPYVHAFYCLGRNHRLIKGRNVFVNGGAGALGQAVISICLALKCNVFTTVADRKKKQFLLRLFPELNESNISFSNHDTFFNTVAINSKGKLCHFVINSANGSLREAAMKCVGFASLFLDVNDTDMSNNKDFCMSYLTEERNYVAINLANLFKPNNAQERKEIQFMVTEGIANGTVRPITRVVYSPPDVTKAFRLLSLSKHRGRVLLKVRDPVSMSLGLKAKPIISYSPNASYVVVCDNKELGVEFIDRLISKGARNIVVKLKYNHTGAYFNTKLMEWEKQQVTIKTFLHNLESEKDCSKMIEEAIELGPVQGVFLALDYESKTNDDQVKQEEVLIKFNDTALLVANMDIVSRILCKDLRHFVVLSRSSQTAADEYMVSVSERICEMRNEVGLPALILHVESLNEIDQKTDLNSKLKTEPQAISAVFNTLELSLKLKYKNVKSYKLKKPLSAGVASKIQEILGVKKIEDISGNLLIGDLSVNEIGLEEIKSVLKEAYQIYCPVEKLKQMSVSSLMELSATTSQNSQFDSGLGAFYTFIDQDECMTTEPMIPMPTKLSNATEKEEELDPKATYIMLIPGFEGHYQIFTSICERLKVPAMTFQLGPDVDVDIPQMAANILNFMKKRFELKSKFYLLGYSFGVNVALELAALIEKEGHVGVVYCLDSSPDALRVQLDAYVGNLTDTQLQDTIAEHMYRLMAKQDSTELKQDLLKLEKWTDKIEACVNRLRGLVNYSHQYKRSILETAYRRIKLARAYRPNLKLESEIVLMKGISHPNAECLPEDYNLSKYSKQPVKVFHLQSDHALAPFDCRISNIVNRLLEPQVLDDFKNKNLCETYLADPFKIL